MSKHVIRIAWVLVWAVFFCPCIAAYSQTADNAGGAVLEPDDASTGKNVQTDQKGVKANEGKAVRKADIDDTKSGKSQETAESPRAARKKMNEKLSSAGGLLDLTHDDFLYRRIPDKKFPQAPSGGGDAFLSESSVSSEENTDISQKKGLFGLSARATDYLAKGFLVFIIAMIVILYRMRSKSRRSAVHKSFR